MAKKSRPDPARDYRAGRDCADAFLRLAEPFVPKIAGLREGPTAEPVGLGELAACATTMSFALELYLKTLLTKLSIHVPRGHPPRPLYDALPGRAKLRVNGNYNLALPRWYGKRASVTIAKGPSAEPAWSDFAHAPMDLPSLLDRSANLFEAWRYVYEFTPTPGALYDSVDFEYGPLLCACEAVRGEI